MENHRFTAQLDARDVLKVPSEGLSAWYINYEPRYTHMLAGRAIYNLTYVHSNLEA